MLLKENSQKYVIKRKLPKICYNKENFQKHVIKRKLSKICKKKKLSKKCYQKYVNKRKLSKICYKKTYFSLQSLILCLITNLLKICENYQFSNKINEDLFNIADQRKV